MGLTRLIKSIIIHQLKKESTMKEYDDWLDLTHDEAYNDYFGNDEEPEEVDDYYEDCKEPY